jgi:RHH-type proline utilization regulon transcriptional repressor/proline dehydrogenase/delta 1-pyrroline-5-carboxylate dehydrogenase
VTPFRNESLLELRRAPVRAALQDALRRLDERLPLAVPALIAGDPVSGTPFESVDPGAPERIVAVAAEATDVDVDAAIAAAEDGFARWRESSAPDRSAVLRRAARRLRERRMDVAALEVRECAKPWPEADADVCEAIDFLEFYAEQAEQLFQGRELLQVPGERNTLHYVPRGVTAVVAPWNFPVAIPAGMVAAALATGNSVVLKPAEQAPACAAALVDALHAAGVPADVLHLLPGAAAVGAALVRHPGVHTITFTGSAAVGMEIMHVAAEPADGRRHLKRVVAEMGGKNCVIVDADADLDDAVPCIVKSAFGFAGQKCSAASRVLVHEAIADRFVDRLGGAIAALDVGQAERFGVDVPPVIDAAAQRRVLGYAERGAVEGRIVGAAPDVPGHGYFCPPTAIAGLAADSPVIQDEIFGPLLSVEPVPSVGAALEVLDASPYGLTGGLFSRNPDTVERVARRSPVGNLYVNREITGAMVARQPFGGNRLSGTGPKAGGPDYLLSFVEPRVVTENTVRHGLVV